jgi:hypothetical protein
MRLASLPVLILTIKYPPNNFPPPQKALYPIRFLFTFQRSKVGEPSEATEIETTAFKLLKFNNRPTKIPPPPPTDNSAVFLEV